MAQVFGGSKPRFCHGEHAFSLFFYFSNFHPQTTFLAPEGKCPLALNLASMGKGQAWVNGQSTGRYWSAYLAPSTGCTKKCDYRGSYDASKCQKHCGQPAQTLEGPIDILPINHNFYAYCIK